MDHRLDQSLASLLAVACRLCFQSLLPVRLPRVDLLGPVVAMAFSQLQYQNKSPQLLNYRLLIDLPRAVGHSHTVGVVLDAEADRAFVGIGLYQQPTRMVESAVEGAALVLCLAA